MPLTFSHWPKDLLQLLIGYLPLVDRSRMRLVSASVAREIRKTLRAQSEGHVVISVPDLSQRPLRLQPRTALRWICPCCRTHTNISESACRKCATAADINPGIRRIFIGQIRKDLTVEFLDWLLAVLTPRIPLFHIENHTTKEGRGRGCAWLYVYGEDAEATLFTLSQRIFLDKDDSSDEEVLHFCLPAAISTLEHIAKSRSRSDGRPLVLPRRLLVVESPVALKTRRKSRNSPDSEAELPSDVVDQHPPVSKSTTRVYQHNPYLFSAVSTDPPPL